MLTIVPYDPAWPAMFEAEASELRAALGADALRIEHVGSTAVAGLAAKPVIDIQVSVPSLAPGARYTEILTRLGYTHMPVEGDFDSVYPFFAKPAEWPSSHHVHLCAAGGEQEAKHLAFRDTLRRQPAVGAEYLALKRSLACLHHGRTPASREAYSLAKTEFVQRVLARAAAEK
jgi:GrpB-like predicted nucleotidyltransferase (UPF0157 family)